MTHSHMTTSGVMYRDVTKIMNFPISNYVGFIWIQCHRLYSGEDKAGSIFKVWFEQRCPKNVFKLSKQSIKQPGAAVEYLVYMVTSANGSLFCVIGPLWGEFTGHQWIPLTKASDAELWCFLWSAPEQTVEQTIKTPVIWDAIVFIMTSL